VLGIDAGQLGANLDPLRLVCDVDGALTAGGLSCDEGGKVLKRFDVRAGLAARMLQQAGITVALLSDGRGGDGALREFSDALLASQGWMEGFETSGVGTTN
jgi:3-deoxy-D-manno-octulosonate 8-phosphate phosphatase KdsC-like HAD superfamily phosphatase